MGRQRIRQPARHRLAGSRAGAAADRGPGREAGRPRGHASGRPAGPGRGIRTQLGGQRRAGARSP